MRCSRCGREFEGGERRFGFEVGWVCWGCVKELGRQPGGECWGGCGRPVGRDGRLVGVVAEDGVVVGRYVHKGCLVQ